VRPTADGAIDRHNYCIGTDQVIVDYALHLLVGDGATEGNGSIAFRHRRGQVCSKRTNPTVQKGRAAVLSKGDEGVAPRDH